MELGRRYGTELGRELGFYIGFAHVALAVCSGDASSRTYKAITALQKLCNTFPVNEPENESLQTSIQAIRVKYRHTCSLLGIHSDSTDQSSVQF